MGAGHTRQLELEATGCGMGFRFRLSAVWLLALAGKSPNSLWGDLAARSLSLRSPRRNEARKTGRRNPEMTYSLFRACPGCRRMDRWIGITAVALALLAGGCTSSHSGSSSQGASRAHKTSATATASSARSYTQSALLRGVCAQVPPALRHSRPWRYFPRGLAALWETPQLGARCILVFRAADNSGRVIWMSGKRDWDGITWAPGGESIVIDTTTNAINLAGTDFAADPGPEVVRWFTRSGRLLSERPGRALGFFPDGKLVLARNGDLFVAKPQGRVRRLAASRTVASGAGFRGTYLSSESGKLGLRTSQNFGNDAVAFVVHQLVPRFAERVIIVHPNGAVEPASPLFHQPGEVDSAVGGL